MGKASNRSAPTASFRQGVPESAGPGMVKTAGVWTITNKLALPGAWVLASQPGRRFFHSP